MAGKGPEPNPRWLRTSTGHHARGNFPFTVLYPWKSDDPNAPEGEKLFEDPAELQPDDSAPPPQEEEPSKAKSKAKKSASGKTKDEIFVLPDPEAAFAQAMPYQNPWKPGTTRELELRAAHKKQYDMRMEMGSKPRTTDKDQTGPVTREDFDEYDEFHSRELDLQRTQYLDAKVMASLADEQRKELLLQNEGLKKLLRVQYGVMLERGGIERMIAQTPQLAKLKHIHRREAKVGIQRESSWRVEDFAHIVAPDTPVLSDTRSWSSSGSSEHEGAGMMSSILSTIKGLPGLAGLGGSSNVQEASPVASPTSITNKPGNKQSRTSTSSKNGRATVLGRLSKQAGTGKSRGKASSTPASPSTTKQVDEKSTKRPPTPVISVEEATDKTESHPSSPTELTLAQMKEFDHPKAGQFLYDDIRFQAAELKVDIRISRARFSLSVADWNGVLRHIKTAEELALKLDYSPLNSRLAFFRACAYAGLDRLDLADAEIEEAWGCKGYYREGEFIEGLVGRIARAREKRGRDETYSGIEVVLGYR